MILVLAQQVQLNPDINQLPGGNVIQQLANGIGGWALLLSLIALVISAAAWALGSNSQNFHYTYVGKRGVLISGLSALLIGGAPAIINFFNGLGTSVTP